MSHEIRTPMTAILGYVALLEENELNEQEAKEALATVRRNGDHLLTVINDILDFSKIRAGQLSSESCPVKPLELVGDAINMLSYQAKAKKTQLSYIVDESVPHAVYTDPTRFRQIIVNLVGNAVKFTEQGSVCVRVDFDSASSCLSIQIHDTGIGMSESQLLAIREFRPFSQADISTTRKFGGTGLGLAISKCLIELLGGDIDVQSQKGTGSTFTFSIKVQVVEGNGSAHLSTSASRALDSIQGAMLGGPLAGLRILLVEDGVDNQRLIKFVLSKAGAEVSLANNGKVAIDMLQAEASDQRDFDIILMDLQMPVMDDYETTRWLRSRGFDRPIIALSAHAIVGAKDDAIAAGCNDYCSKPIEKEVLIRACRASLA